MIFINIKCQWDFIMENKPVAQPWGCYDLHTADGESVRKRTAIAYVVYSSQKGIRLNRGQYINGSHFLSKHAFIEIVSTTKEDLENASKSTSLKVFHVYVCLRKGIRSRS